MKAVIVGGGLSGCTMAYLLRKQGYDVTIIEKNPWIGGLCKTFHEGENKYEFGPHVLHSDKPRVTEFVKKLAHLRETRFKAKACPFNSIDKLYDYPLTVSNILRLDNPEDIIWELYALNPEKLDGRNFESYVISMIGPTLYSIFIKNYNKKQWGVDPAQMSAMWAPKRIVFSKNNDTPFHQMWSVYPPDGYDGFFSNLTKGVRIVRGSFQSLKIRGNTVEAVILDGGSCVEGELFVSSIPLDSLLNSYERLVYRGIYKSFIQIKRRRLIDDLWYTFPNHYNFTRIVEYKGYNFEDNDTTIVSAAFPFDSGEVDRVPEQSYGLEFRSALQHLFMVHKGELLSQFGMKDAYSYPVITDNSERLFRTLIGQLAGFENLFSVGRLGLFVYIPMYICISQCLKLVELIESYHTLSTEQRINKYLEIR